MACFFFSGQVGPTKPPCWLEWILQSSAHIPLLQGAMSAATPQYVPTAQIYCRYITFHLSHCRNVNNAYAETKVIALGSVRPLSPEHMVDSFPPWTISRSEMNETTMSITRKPSLKQSRAEMLIMKSNGVSWHWATVAILEQDMLLCSRTKHRQVWQRISLDAVH